MVIRIGMSTNSSSRKSEVLESAVKSANLPTLACYDRRFKNHWLL